MVTVRDLNRALGRSVELVRHRVLHVQLMRFVSWASSRLGESDVWLMYGMDLTKPIAPRVANVSFEVDVARYEDMKEAAALYHHDDASQVPERARWFRGRLANGSHCFIARIDGVIVAYNWIRLHAAVGVHDVAMSLPEDEIYMTDAFTAHAWRGKGIHAALNWAMLRFAKDSGYLRTWSLVRADNLRSWITLPRLGWRHSGTLAFFRPRRVHDRALWFVGGSAHPMPLARGLQWRELHGVKSAAGPGIDGPMPHDEHAIEQAFGWVSGYFAFDRSKEIRTWPWSRTFRFGDGERIVYLKVVPRTAAASIHAIELLSRAFPGTIPEVIACDRERGWLLTAEHGGTKLAFDSPPAHLHELVETYARLQSRCRTDRPLLSALPEADGPRLLSSLLDFLGADDATPPVGGNWAGRYLGARYAHKYRAALVVRREMLERYMAPATRLPMTLNHGGLRPTNAALTDAGDCVLFSWSEASRGPAGLSLHSLFSGCLKPARLLSGDASDTLPNRSRRKLLDHYIRSLVHGGYSDEQTLRQCLPASITIGVVQYLCSFAKYPAVDDHDRKLIGRNLESRLNALLDLCDHLSTRSRRAAIEYSEDYRLTGNLERAQSILAHFLDERPDDVALLQRLCTVLAGQGKLRSAQKALRRAIALAPDQAFLHYELGSILMQDLKFVDAFRCFERVLVLDPAHGRARRQADRALHLERSWESLRSLAGGEAATPPLP